MNLASAVKMSRFKATFIRFIRFIRMTLSLLALLFMTSNIALSQQTNHQVFGNNIIGLRFGEVSLSGSAALRVVVETEQSQPVKLLLLSDPWRLVMDFENMGWNINAMAREGKLNRAPAIAYRFGHPKPDIGRLVIELSAPAAPGQTIFLPHNGIGHRLVIDLIDKGETQFKLTQKILVSSSLIFPKPGLPKTLSSKEPRTGNPETLLAPTLRPQRWVVAIDAGHGGKDPGAIGKKGTKEKIITLAAAHQLAKYLNKSGQVSARLIRSDDRFYKLRKRISIAHEMGADIFVSLHADSARRSSARGISVFSLSDKASDDEAAFLARKENRADQIGGSDLEGRAPVIVDAILDMHLRAAMNESAKLASIILTEIKEFPGGDKRGHRFAGFAVLKSPDMPSVLIEMGFLSNSNDEKNLNSPAYRDRLTQQLAKAILAYLNSSS